MLVLERRTGEAILIYPQEGIDPTMTVAELFAQGPIRVSVKCREQKAVKLAIQAPHNIKILRDELDPALEHPLRVARPQG